jgi:hypothetical protein
MRSAAVQDHGRTPEIEVSAEPPGPFAGFLRPAKAFLLHELGEILPPTIFFFIGFNLIVLATNLLVADYFVTVGNFMLATVGALLIGKAVGIANAMPLMRRYDRAPLIRPILFKTLIYWAAVFIVRLLERLVEYWLIDHNPISGFLSHLVTTFDWHRFAAIQIWILVLFLVYVTASEFNRLFGHGELTRILFTYRPSELQLNRRQQIHELVRLGKLTDAHSLDELRDPASSAHAQLVDIVQRLARQSRPHRSVS